MARNLITKKSKNPFIGLFRSFQSKLNFYSASIRLPFDLEFLFSKASFLFLDSQRTKKVKIFIINALNLTLLPYLTNGSTKFPHQIYRTLWKQRLDELK